MPSSDELRPLLLRLCKGLEAQTKAITALAQSNERLADELMAGDPDDEPDQPSRYMDGTPVN